MNKHKTITLSLAILLSIYGGVKATPPIYRGARRQVMLSAYKKNWKQSLETGELKPNSPIMKLTIPSVEIDILILQASSEKKLYDLPCISKICSDIDKSPIIVAHRDLHFRNLKEIQVGDKVFVQHIIDRQEFIVTKIETLTPEEAELQSSNIQTKTLTLITCFPFHYIGSAPKRFVVTCQPIQ